MPASNHSQERKINSLDACDPSLNATVSASAGSGKTWLLITRIVRLLLDGNDAGNIIALTFTRKAANEMQIRLNERLREMSTCDDATLDGTLQLIGCTPNQSNRHTARGLYENLLRSLHPIRIQTFHSFCQDILTRFPLEADIPPGFELTEDSSQIEKLAWIALFSEAGVANKTALATALDRLMAFCNGPSNTWTSLHNFLSHRSDWWAFTSDAKDSVSYASNALAQTLQLDGIDDTDDIDSQQPARMFLDDEQRLTLAVFANLLRENKTATNDAHAETIDSALTMDDPVRAFELIKTAFLTRAGDKLTQGRRYSKAMEKKLGSENAQRFLDLHDELGDAILTAEEQRKRLHTLQINIAWYRSGNRYIDIFQQIKRDRRLLDFTDLEWKCYRLLRYADNAHWVQYKIDQRIDHLLIDEFQDTNPTQWHLLAPILEEIAANPEQRPRSVFLVGDEKQSIYSFRRANPALQSQASRWLKEHLDARATPLDFSRRSSGAIMRCVNAVFEQDEIRHLMPGFTPHDTYLDEVPGKVFLCDLFRQDEATQATEPVYFRNSLEQPRHIQQENPRHQEASFIAEQIDELVKPGSLLTDHGVVRQVSYGDIMILLRNRTHIALYEEALKAADIPFIGSKKGGLLDNLEVQDLICLLNTLITPFNNLALAQLLKSPIFSASDEDLIILAESTGKAQWFETLLHLAQTDSPPLLSEALQRAAGLLLRWQTYAESLPVHDCLDKIFSEGDIIRRYSAANHDTNKNKVAANCQRLLEMSLETEAGRYPSITRFLQQLQHLQFHADNPPEEPLASNETSRVSLMTIHASKGLEAPIVFLADCNNTSTDKNAYDCLVHWPAESPAPANFQLQLSKARTDMITQDLQATKREEKKREELNLLYVALTRAREKLYISGTEKATGKQQKDSWYRLIQNGLTEITTRSHCACGHACSFLQHLDYEGRDTAEPATAEQESDDARYDHRLLSPLPSIRDTAGIIAPSHFDTSIEEGVGLRSDFHDQSLARWRGTAIHQVLEMLCDDGTYPTTDTVIASIRQRLQREATLHNPAYLLSVDDCIDQALRCYHATSLSDIFNPDRSSQAYNEMPLLYRTPQQAVYGVLDRVIKNENEVLIIDYKSHTFAADESTTSAAASYRTQLDYYEQGIRLLWPDSLVRKGILFTERREINWL